MDRMIIRGGSRIEGSVQICGAKNAALPQIAAALLSSEQLELANVPKVSDIDTMVTLMQELGVTATHSAGHRLVLDARGARNTDAPYDIVRRMRASILVLAPLLARFGSARVSLPGGCAIGARPIDQHLKALEGLGAQVNLESGYIDARASGEGLRGGRIVLSSPSVGATETAIMAAVLARGETENLNAARDPEVADLSDCLAAMGACLEGAGTHRILVQGVQSLHRARHDLIADRVEAGTYAIAAAITGGRLEILGCPPRTSRRGRCNIGRCRCANLADGPWSHGGPLRSVAGDRHHHRALSRISHRPAGTVYGVDDDRIGRIDDPGNRV